MIARALVALLLLLPLAAPAPAQEPADSPLVEPAPFADDGVASASRDPARRALAWVSQGDGTIVAVTLVFLLLIALLGRLGRGRPAHLTLVRIGLDAAARRRLAPAVREPAHGGDPEALRQATTSLLREQAAWTHVAWIAEEESSPVEGVSLLRSLCAQTRGRVRRSATPAQPVDGAAVLTLGLVARREPLVTERARDSAAAARVVSAVAELRATDLVAVELVWTPTSASDALGPDELARAHPELTPLGRPARG